MFSRDIEDLNQADIQRLVSETRLSESDRIEYKKTLPVANNQNDPWLEGENEILPQSSKKIAQEVIAFANTHGVTIIIGIEEDDQAKPAAVNLLPRCNQLEVKLLQGVLDKIEPRIDGVLSKSIVFTNDEGVIVIRVPRSNDAPHRLISSREFFLRERTESRKMTVQEIKSLSLKRARQEIEALWSVRFRMQHSADVNGGVVILSEGKIYGGDSQYFYNGIYEFTDDSKFTGYLRIQHYHGPAYTAFGTSSSTLDIVINGDLIDNVISGSLTDTQTNGQIPFTMERRTNLV